MSKKIEVKIGDKDGSNFAYFVVTQSSEKELCLCTRNFPEGMSEEECQKHVMSMAWQALQMLPVTAAIDLLVNTVRDVDDE